MAAKFHGPLQGLPLGAARVQVDWLAALSREVELLREDVLLLGLLLWASRPFVVEADFAEDIGLGQMRGQIGERVCEFGVRGLGDPRRM